MINSNSEYWICDISVEIVHDADLLFELSAIGIESSFDLFVIDWSFYLCHHHCFESKLFHSFFESDNLSISLC